MRYALLGPGKRIRPVLTLAVAEMCGARDLEPVVDLGAAVELVHAGSLILDDLPAMDDAQVRRGRPATHRVFGEAVALLAAFALLNRAHALAAASARRLSPDRYGPEAMVQALAEAIGTRGLVGGQALDLASGPAEIDLERLEVVQSRKTGALFVAAAGLGAMAADAGREELEAVSRFAGNVGLAFQIQDDLHDRPSTPESTGGDAGPDDGRVTFVRRLGVEGARALAAERLAGATAALTPFGDRAGALLALAAAVGASTLR